MFGLSKKLLICSASVTLFIFIGSYVSSQPPTPGPSEASQQPKPAAQKKKQNPQPDKRGTIESPFVIEILPTQGHDKQTTEASNNENKESASDWGNRSEFWLFVTTVFLAVVTAALACFTAKLWGATNRLVRGTNDAEAAYVLPHITRQAGFFEEPPVLPRPMLFYKFKNHGKTLAIIRRWRDFTSLTLPPQPRFLESWDEREIVYIPVIEGEEGGEIWAQTPGSREEMVELMRNDQPFYLIGEVEYEDIFGVARIQGFCLRIINVHPDGNVQFWRDGGHAYNQRREA